MLVLSTQCAGTASWQVGNLHILRNGVNDIDISQFWHPDVKAATVKHCCIVKLSRKKNASGANICLHVTLHDWSTLILLLSLRLWVPVAFTSKWKKQDKIVSHPQEVKVIKSCWTEGGHTHLHTSSHTPAAAAVVTTNRLVHSFPDFMAATEKWDQPLRSLLLPPPHQYSTHLSGMQGDRWTQLSMQHTLAAPHDKPTATLILSHAVCTAKEGVRVRLPAYTSYTQPAGSSSTWAPTDGISQTHVTLATRASLAWRWLHFWTDHWVFNETLQWNLLSNTNNSSNKTRACLLNMDASFLTGRRPVLLGSKHYTTQQRTLMCYSVC